MAKVGAGRVTLVSPVRHSLYSGMIPATLAGVYSLDEGAIDVAALAARAHCTFLADRVTELRVADRQLVLASGRTLSFDILSLDPGSSTRGAETVAGATGVIPVRPVEQAARTLRQAFAKIRAGELPPHIGVVGGGASGIELAFGIHAALKEIADVEVVLLERSDTLLPDQKLAVRRRIQGLLEAKGIRVRRGLGDIETAPGGLRSATGEAFALPTVVWATGAEPHPWLRETGLMRSGDGFLLVGPDLRCRGAEAIFAVGDCAQLADHPVLPRAGVFAVRQGPVLAHNLRVMLEERGRMRRWRPQAGFLKLLSTGDGRAIALYRGRASHGRIWWHLKKLIDERFVRRFRRPNERALVSPGGAMDGAMEPCGGCAAKLPPAVLEEAIFAPVEGEAGASGSAMVGLAARDDAAIFVAGPNGRVVTTLDAFPPFLGDLREVAAIGAVNAASDIYAMGGRPRQALVLAGLSPGAGAADELRAILLGARQAFDKMGVEILGGHSVALETPLIGFTVFGELEGTPLLKAGARPGDVLVLTKPLGTGVVLAASGAGECPARWHESALASMHATNARAAELLREAGATACTDVSGFGLLGHTLEMLEAGSVSAELELNAIPVLPGALELVGAGWRSTAAPGLSALLGDTALPAQASAGDARVEILLDPQTSGGLLAAIPENRLAWFRTAAREAEVELAAIGTVQLASADAPRLRMR
jgi:selenide,water dikinase